MSMDNMTKQIPPGYKKTEIGIIPEDWEVKRLGEAAKKLTMGQSPNSTYYNDKGVGLPLIQGNADLKDSKTLKRIYTNQITKLCKQGDIILTVRAPVGKVAKTGFNACIGRGVCAISYENDFLFYYLQFIENLWTKFSSGSTFDAVDSNTIKNLLIPFPVTLEEQRAITCVLSDIDQFIESLDKLIEKKKLIKRGAMQLLLTGKKRLPGFKGEWVRRRLGEVAIIKKGDLITEKEARRGNVPVIGGGIGPTYYHNKANRKANTITISASGANAGYVSFHKHPIFASDCSTIEKSGNYDVRFLYFLLKSMQNTITMLQTGGAQPHVYPEQLKQLEIYYPLDMEEQRAIAQILSDMDAEIEALERKKEKYEMLKKGAMELLLTGKIRLKDYIDEVLG